MNDLTHLFLRTLGLGVGIALIVLLHAAVWHVVVRKNHWPQKIRRFIKCAFASTLSIIIALLVLSRLLPPDLARMDAMLCYSEMGLIYVFAVAAFIVEVCCAWGGFKKASLKRRQVTCGVFVVATLYVLCSFIDVWQDAPEVVDVEINLPHFPPEFNHLKIAQLSDLHLTPYVSPSYLKRVVQTVNARKPDLIAITGDLVDGQVDALSDALEPLRALDAPLGIFFCTGNHEYYSGADGWVAYLSQLGIKSLRNETVIVERLGAQFELAGVEDLSAKNYPNSLLSSNVFQATTDHRLDRALILLAHQPAQVWDAKQARVDLMLSGHTHGGLPWPFHVFQLLSQPYLHGLHRAGPLQIYVNSGSGYWGLPLRPGSKPEVTLLHLRHE